MAAFHGILEPYIIRLYCDDCNSETLLKLRGAVEDTKRHMTSAQFSSLMTRLCDNATDLVNSENRDVKYKSVGVAILDCFLDITDEVTPERRIWIADQLRRLLENERLYIDVHADILRSVAISIGHLARISSTTERDYLMNFYTNCVIKWIGDLRSEIHRFSGVLTLRQLAINLPALVFSKRKLFYNSIWEVLFDKNYILRGEAAVALEAVLTLIHQRGNTDEFLRLAIVSIDHGCQSTLNEKIHGSILIFESLINVIPSNELMNIIRKEFSFFIWGVLKRKDIRDVLIKKKVIEMIPKLAATSSIYFLHDNKYTTPNNFLIYSVEHLLNTIKIQNEYRQVAYLSLGELFIALSMTLRDKKALIKDVLTVIKDGFEEPFCIEALQCLSMVVKVSPVMRKCVDDDLVQLTFQGGLTPHLINCLKVFVRSTPEIRSLVQTRLLRYITSVLLRYLVHLDDGNSPSHRNNNTKTVPKRTTVISRMTGVIRGTSHSISENVQDDAVDEQELILALKVLASFDFLPKRRDHTECARLLSVVREGAVRYLDDSNVTIRDTAAVTCATVLDKVVDSMAEGSDERRVVLQVMDRLLVLGVGDNDETVRVNVFKSLPPSLDKVIADSSTLHCVIEALNDESIHVRSAAMSVLSRVSHYDTLHIMPLMHFNLSELIRQLQMSKNLAIKQESVLLIRAMVRGINKLIIPYAEQVLEPLLELLCDMSPDIVASALSTIGDLSTVSPTHVGLHIEDLFPRILDAMNDHSSINKQIAAVTTIGKMVSSLCITEDSYISHPKLYESIVSIIQTTDPIGAELRVQAIKTAGLLGAVDEEHYNKEVDTSAATSTLKISSPKELETIKMTGKDENENENQEEASKDIHDQIEEATTLDTYYLTVVMNALVTILRDSSLSAHHQTASSVAMRIIKNLGLQCLPQIDNFINGVVFRIYKTEETSLQQILLSNLISLIIIFGRNIQKHLNILIKLVCSFIQYHLQSCLELVEALYTAMPFQDISIVLREILPLLSEILREEAESTVITEEISPNTSANDMRSLLIMSISHRVAEKKVFVKTSNIMRTLAVLSSSLGEYRPHVIAMVLNVLERHNATIPIRKESLYLAMLLVRQSEDLQEFASRIVHPILRLLSSTESSFQGVALTSLSCLLCILRAAYLPFVIPARRAIQRMQTKPMQLEEYEKLVMSLLNQRPLPTQPATACDVAFTYDDSRRARVERNLYPVHENLTVGLQTLESAWTLSGRATAADLLDWMRRMSIEFVKQTPSPILRPCAGLAQVYEPLAAQLFNVCFMSLWDQLADSTSSDVVNDIAIITSIEQALQIPQIPSKIRHTLLNLAEFMETRDKRLPLDVKLLASQAEKANMLAISLRYRELEFASPNTPPSSECIEALITINNQLGLRESASGVLQHVRMKYKHIIIKPLWLEKLYRWDDAKQTYSEQIEELTVLQRNNDEIKPEKWVASQLGIMRCLNALGEYEACISTASYLQDYVQKNGAVHEKLDSWMCELQQAGATAAWGLGRWSDMDAFIDGQYLSKHHDQHLFRNGSFYQAVLAIHKQEFNKASRLITQLRESLATSIGSLLNESYSRANQAMITMQTLTEMEEVLEYKMAASKAKAYQESVTSLGHLSGSSVSSMNQSRIVDNVGLDRVLSDASDKRNGLLLKWKRRWQRSPKNVDTYRQILGVRMLAIEPSEDLDSWLELVSYLRKEHMLTLCENILKRLGAPLVELMMMRNESDDDDGSASSQFDGHILSAHPRVLFAMHKYLWEAGERDLALRQLNGLVSILPQGNLDDMQRLLKVQCLLRRAEWTRILYENRLTDTLLNDVLDTVQTARDLSPAHYSVWHAWAVTNYYQLRLADSKETAEEVVGTPGHHDDSTTALFQPEKRSLTKDRIRRPRSMTNLLSLLEDSKIDTVTPYVIEAIKGFIRSISLGKDQPVANVLQDTLRLLTLWFAYGSKQKVFACLDAELDCISAEDWLSVIPQLIARMHMKAWGIARLLRKALTKVALAHPQALVYPISVAVNNVADELQGQVATDVLQVISQNNAQLVSEAAVVSRELLRVAISPHEMWSEGLERAADLYIVSRDIEGMLEIFHGLNAAMGDWDVATAPSTTTAAMSGTTDTLFSTTNTAQQTIQKRAAKSSENSSIIDKETLRDISFRQEFGRDLCGAYEWLMKFERTKNIIDLHQAWDIYHNVFKRISVLLKSLKVLELSHISPRLTDSESLMLAVPGTYKPFRDIVRIASFAKTVDVIASKQRPRKMTIIGSDGNEYRFLLKGHEDLRQDERVMQLFHLINACLENNRNTRRRGYKIVRYTVLPLSNNAGLIGWVENCDTLNQLVKRYREQRDLHLDAEQRLLKVRAPDFERLPLLHKVEIFKDIQNETSGKDLAMMLWLNSTSSDVWVQRRANYTKSLAAMSMVGYILGLGDRHPSNLMLDRVSGRVVHIDFGDCFEVAMNRDTYPETVPFRLTRMLIQSMEAAGIEGTFRSSSEIVMRILRDNRDSVMAMLEAFVYDPLISWRLLGTQKDVPRVAVGQDSDARAIESSGAVHTALDSLLMNIRDVSLSGDITEENSNINNRDNNSIGRKEIIMAHSQMNKQMTRRDVVIEETSHDTVHEDLNSRALEIINRIQSKLTGRDFDGGEYLLVEQQVDRLISSATSPENLCQLFLGWCPFW